MKKQLDLSKTVSQLVKEYPEVKDIMVDLGFKDITSPAALMFMGKVMTIPKGSAIKGIPMERIVAAFEGAGFEVVGIDGVTTDDPAAWDESPDRDEDKGAQLKALIARLNAGEDLESVRADFVRQFESVAVDDIVAAEQDLLDEGMPLVEVQRMCDLHSALLHGHTEAEACAVTERSEVPAGHPVDVLRRENRALEQVLDRAEAALAASDGQGLVAALAELRGIGTLYSKKESILMPMLLHHGVTGPSDVMWGVDDEIKAEVARLYNALAADASALPDLRDDVAAVLTRMREMVYKEENIFFPLCLQNLSDDEWLEAYRDLPEMGNVFAGEPPRWQWAELELAVRASLAARGSEPDDGIIRMPGGELTLAQLKALFAVLPIDITFIDADDVNRFFTNEGKVFARPLSALGRSTYECHPERVKPMVRQLLDDFKSGARDTMEVWTPNPDHPVRVLYAAVRDEDGTYLGAAELVEDFTAVRERFCGSTRPEAGER